MHIRSISAVEHAGRALTGNRHTLWWLASQSATGATMGAFAVLELAPGARDELHRHPGSETTVFVLDGAAQLLSSTDSMRLERWDGAYIPKRVWHGLHNDRADPLLVALIYGGEPNPARERMDQDRPDDGEPAGKIRKLEAPDRIDTSPHGGLPEEYGLRDAGDHWYVTGESVGSERLQVRLTRFAPGGGHFGLHRHHHAEEFFMVLAGGGAQLTRTGETSLTLGDLVFTPQAEEHGWRNGPDHGTSALAGWFGANSPESSGYEQTEYAHGTAADGPAS